MNRVFKLIFLFGIREVYGNRTQSNCTEEDMPGETACEGHDVSIRCPLETHRIVVEFAEYAREQPEYIICRRPKNSTIHNRSPTSPKLSCKQNVLKDVTDICGGKTSCDFNVNSSLFHDPCPQLYKYFHMYYKCVCPKRYLRSTGTSSSSCYSPLPTTSQYVPQSTEDPMVTSTPTLNSSTATKTNTLPFTRSNVSSTPCPEMRSRFSPVATSASINTSAFPVTRAKMDMSKKTFFVLLELFVIYNETVHKDPTLAILWCLLGMLVGLVLMTIVLVVLIKSRKPRDKRMFCLSQLESEQSNVESPTIHRRHSPPEIMERRHIRDKQEDDGTCVNTNQYEDGSLANLDSPPDTFIFTNPLWTDREQCPNQLGSKSSDETNEIPPHGSEGMTSNEVTETKSSTNNVTKMRETCRYAEDESRDSLIKKNESEKNDETSGGREFYFKTRDQTPKIPVGIPSRPVSMDSILLKDCRVRGEAARDSRTQHPKNIPSLSNSRYRHSLCENHVYPTVKLLSTFGVKNDIHEPGYSTLPSASSKKSKPYPEFALPVTALSLPCLHRSLSTPNQLENNYSKTDTWTGKEKPDGNADTSNSRTQTPRSRRLHCTNPSNHSEFPLNTTTSSHENCVNRASTRKERSPQEVDAKTSLPNHGSSESRASDHKNKQSKKSSNAKEPVLTPEENACEISPTQKRSSSGYFSNNTSPSVEHSFGLANLQKLLNSTLLFSKKDKINEDTQMDVDHKQYEAGDDLPPLPPPAPPLPPPSLLPHIYPSGVHSTRSTTHRDKHEQRGPARTAVKKVHFDTKTS